MGGVKAPLLAALALAALVPASEAGVLRVPVKTRQRGSTDADIASIGRERVWTPDHFAVPSSDGAEGKLHELRLHNQAHMYYFAEISLGTPPQKFEMAFDTLSDDVWVPNVPVGAHNVYNHNASSTYVANGTEYYTPLVSGYMSLDTMRIGDLELPRQFFAEVNVSSVLKPGYTSCEFDGFFGLGFGPMTVVQVDPPFIRLVKEGKLDRPMFGFYFGRDQRDGELTLGGVNPSLFKGDLHFVDVVDRNRWSIQVDTATIGQETIRIASAALVTTGGPLLFGPADEIDAIAKALGAKKGEYRYTIDCSASPPDLVLIIDGHPLIASKDGYIRQEGQGCVLNVVRGMPWLIGMPLFRNYYTAFDADEHQPRIGFAEAA